MALAALIRPMQIKEPVLEGGNFSPPYSQWFRDLRTRTNQTPPTGWVSVMDYGATGNGEENDLPAFQAAIAALTAASGSFYAGGGVVFMPPGQYLLDGVLDLVVARKAIWLMGCGPQVSRILSTVTSGHAIRASAGVLNPSTFTENNRLSHFTLDRSDFAATIPASVAGNYGILASGNAGVLTMDRLEIRGFGDAGIRVEGPTGPVDLENIKILYCAGYAISIGKDAANEPTQDVSVRGGAMQGCLGGIFADSAGSLNITDADIENDDSTLPAIRLTGATLGAVLMNNSCRCSTLPTPAAVVAFDGGASGCVWYGGVTNADVDGVDNVLMTGATTEKNVVIGGVHANHGAGSGYFARVADASTQNVFVNPKFVAGQFAAGLDTVNNVNGVANTSTAIGVGMNNATAATATGGAGTLPANPVAFIVTLLPDGTSVRVPYYAA